jgi:tetratricopeptide (TPR) repeat protein
MLDSFPVREHARFFLDPGDESVGGGIGGQLRIGHVFETLLDRVNDGAPDLLSTCRRHLVVDERSGEVYSCFGQYQEREPGHALFGVDGDEPALPVAVSPGSCPDCIARSISAMRASLLANRRESEGRQVYFELAEAFAARGRHRAAADLARHAGELSETDADRSAALIHEGMCRLETREFEPAEEALARAAAMSADPGFVAYQRGRVQFEWRDYIEALERFQEALDHGAPQVPRGDICYQMALCHINIEEYAEAFPFLEQSPTAGSAGAPVVFYRGICELGQGRVEAAMRFFEEALRIGPSSEDLGRVLFYVGTCFKELGKFEAAIEVLERAKSADPGDIANHNLLGFCYYKTRRHEEAVACFRRAVEIDPRSAIDWANLGSNLRDLGRTAEAVAMYEKALSLDPLIGFARENLARLRKGRPE